MPIDPTLACCLDLCLGLNAVATGRLSVPEAEARLLADERIHSVHDAAGILGLPVDEAVPLRRALSRTPVGAWALLLPSPGHPGGLRGPASTNAEALARGCAVVFHAGGPAWVCDPVGEGVQWLVLPAERPILPDPPQEAAAAFTARVIDAAQDLRGLAIDMDRPRTEIPVLGPDYPATSQPLLARAWTVMDAAASGLEASTSATTSHQVLRREAVLRPLAVAAADAVSSAVSWPAFTLVE